jgi:arylmalonate decarboxylase
MADLSKPVREISHSESNDDWRPRRQFGMILPAAVVDFIFHQFYQVFAPHNVVVGYALNLQSFTAAGVDEALKSFWPAFDFLAGRRVERISLSGVPLSAYAGRPKILEFLGEAKKRSDIPTSTDFEEVIEAIRHLGIKRVAVAAKWDPPQMKAVEDYLRHAGMEITGSRGNNQTAQQVFALGPEQGVAVALEIGRRALRDMPEADGLFIAGGAWSILEAIPVLEAEFGKPVVTNPSSTYWAALRQSGQQCRRRGFGKLLDSTIA